MVIDWLKEVFRKKESKILRRITESTAVIMNRLNCLEQKIMANTEALTKLRDGMVTVNEKVGKVLDILNKLQSEAGQLTPEQQKLIDEATTALDDTQVKLDAEIAESTPPGEPTPTPLSRRGRR